MRGRLVASAVVAALVLGATAGCTFITPQVTMDHYDPSDGIGANIDGLEVRNALLLTADGTTASLLINVVNPNKYGTNVHLQYLNSTGAKVDNTFYINGNAVKSFGGTDQAQILLTDVDAKAGTLFNVFVQPEGETGKQLALPVLDGSSSEYASLVPKG
ncbi:MAG: hypothetical protein IT191_04520 [Microbacteriaceae bacterium]|nr:hypothetical protein [Microbacteriaceae bacterium]